MLSVKSYFFLGSFPCPNIRTLSAISSSIITCTSSCPSHYSCHTLQRLHDSDLCASSLLHHASEHTRRPACSVSTGIFNQGRQRIIMLCPPPHLHLQTRELNTNRMYGESEKYSKMVLICDSLAVIEYAVIGITAATVLALVFIFDFQLFQ